MKFIASIFIVVLLAFSSVSAQASGQYEILAEGSERLTQGMVNRLVGFFEWALEVEFSTEERAEFQNQIIENWKNGDSREMRGMLYVLEFSREIDHWDEDKRQKAQILLKERFLKELEKNDSNKINALLLGSYRQKHGRIDSLTTAVKQ